MNHPSAGNWEGDSYNWDRKKQTKTNKKYDQNIYDEIKRYAAYIWDFIVTYFNDFKSEKYTRLWFEKYQSYIWDIFIKGSQNITKFGQYVYNEFPRCSTYIWEFIVKYFDEFRSGTYTRRWFEKYSPYIWDMQKMTNFGQFIYNEFTKCSSYIWNFIVQVTQFVWDIIVQGAQMVAFRFYSGTYTNEYLIFFTKPFLVYIYIYRAFLRKPIVFHSCIETDNAEIHTIQFYPGYPTNYFKICSNVISLNILGKTYILLVSRRNSTK